MTTTQKVLYGTRTSLTVTGLNSLANNAAATSNAVDNSTTLAQDYLIEIAIAGTAAANAVLQILLIPSEDNSNFATQESAILLGVINLSATPQRAFFSLLNLLFECPKYFKVMIVNNTGASLSGSGNSVNYQAINIQNV